MTLSATPASLVESNPMTREAIRVEPLSTYLDKWRAPVTPVVRSGDTIYVSGFPPFDPATGEVYAGPFERQAELVLDQMKLCLETAGSSLEAVLKCNVYCTSVERFAAFNAIWGRPNSRVTSRQLGHTPVQGWTNREGVGVDALRPVFPGSAAYSLSASDPPIVLGVRVAQQGSL
jgi:2-iminobutanoate/2-iminopropanoate deaminase